MSLRYMYLKGLLIFCNFLLVITNALGAKGARFFQCLFVQINKRRYDDSSDFATDK